MQKVHLRFSTTCSNRPDSCLSSPCGGASCGSSIKMTSSSATRKPSSTGHRSSTGLSALIRTTKHLLSICPKSASQAAISPVKVPKIRRGSKALRESALSFTLAKLINTLRKLKGCWRRSQM